MEYYLESSEKVLQELKSSEQGLSSQEAAARLQQQGKNRLAEEEKRSGLRKFLDSIMDPMILMLLGAALVQVIVTILESRGTQDNGKVRKLTQQIALLEERIRELEKDNSKG